MKFKFKVLFAREKLNLLQEEFVKEKESCLVFQAVNRRELDKVSPTNKAKHTLEFYHKRENIKFIEGINN